jgi:hypothetical protein
VKTFLTEVINIRDTGYFQSVMSSLNIMARILTAADKNFVCPIFVSQLWCITLSRLLWSVDSVSKYSQHQNLLPLYLGPCFQKWRLGSNEEMNVEVERTNLMATCCWLSRLVPSKITPNEPSPIFFPTR